MYHYALISEKKLGNLRWFITNNMLKVISDVCSSFLGGGGGGGGG